MMTTSTTTRTRWGVAVATAFLATCMLGGCSTQQPTDDPTTDQGTPGVTFAGCLRDKGYDAPDGDGNGLSLSVPDGVDRDQYEADVASCAKASGRGPGGAEQATRLDADDPAWKKTVACVREHGFEDFPDDPNTAYTPSDDEAFADAMHACGGGGGATGAE